MIELTPEQKLERKKKKIEEFNKGLQNLQDKTGMVIFPKLTAYPDRMQAEIALIEREEFQKVIRAVPNLEKK